MHRLVIWATVVTLQLGLVTASAASSQRTDALVDKANRLYSELAFEEALQSLQQAVAIPGNSRAQLMQIYHLQGLCLGSLENYPAAKQAFARLLALDPQFQLASNVSPRVRQPFDEVLQAQPQRLEVRLQPPDRAIPGEPLVFVATVGPDPQRMVTALLVHHRRGASGDFRQARIALPGPGTHRLTVSARDWQGTDPGAVAWYASIDDEHAAHLQVYADATRPMSILVAEVVPVVAAVGEPTPWWPWAVAGGGALLLGVAAITAAVVINQPPADQKVDFGIDVSTRQ